MRSAPFILKYAAIAILTVVPVITARPAPAQATRPATPPPSIHVEGPHLFLGDGEVTALWSCGNERHAITIEAGDTIDVPSWRGTAAIEDLPLAPPTVGPSVFDLPSRMLVLGDIHGRFKPFVAVLQRAGVIDESGAWAFGDGHLVCCGDLMDRGAGVTDALWLLHRLQREAASAGGAVHVLLGNHEHMVLQHDLRYLHPDVVGVADVLGVPYPELFGPTTVLGRWLRTCHSIIRIGDLAFVHGGIGPTLLRHCESKRLDHDDINALVRRHIDADPKRPDADPLLRDLFGYPGPLWHRGYFIENDPIYDPASDDDLDRALAWLEARAVVVGHTQFDRVGTHREGRVIATDVNLENTPEAVLIEGERMLRVTASGVREPLRPIAPE